MARSNWPFALGSRGEAYRQKGDYDRALADLDKSIDFNPRDGFVLGGRGEVHRFKGQLDRALADFDAAISLNPRDDFAFARRGEVYREKGVLDRAMADLSEAIRLNPRNEFAYASRGEGYRQKADFKRAIADLNEAIRLNPRYGWAYGRRGEAYRGKGDLDRAIADLGEAIRLNPRDDFAYASRGEVYRQKDDLDRAIADLNEAIRLNSRYGWAFGSRGAAYRLKNDLDRAIADLSEAIRLNPATTSPTPSAASRTSRRATSAGPSPTSTRRSGLTPALPTPIRSEGALLSAKGDHDRAILDLDKAIRLNPNGLAAYSDRGKAGRRRATATGRRTTARCWQSSAGPGGSGRAGEDPAQAGDAAGRPNLLAPTPSVKPGKTPGKTPPPTGVPSAPPPPAAASNDPPTAGKEKEIAVAAATKKAPTPAAKDPAPGAPGKQAAPTGSSKDTSPVGALTLPPPPPGYTPAPTQAPSAGVATLGRRVALVIGNATYRLGPLQNPVNDAEAMAKALLQDLKFDKVILKKDVTAEGFRAALREFAREVVGAGLGLVYYAGHGTEVGGKNSGHVPVDAQLAKAGDLDLEAIALDTVVAQLAGVTTLKLVILDACRNNVFALAGAQRQGRGRGLARVDNTDESTLVFYAAKDGTTADDGLGHKHSPFTAALLKHIATLARKTGSPASCSARCTTTWITSTGRQQQPHWYGTFGRTRIFLRR